MVNFRLSKPHFTGQFSVIKTMCEVLHAFTPLKQVIFYRFDSATSTVTRRDIVVPILGSSVERVLEDRLR